VALVRTILSLAVILLLSLFFAQNSGQVVDVRFFGWEYLAIPLYLVLLIAFVAGLLLALLAAAWREVRLRTRLRRLQKEIREKDREIADLRALPLENLPAGDAGEE